MENTSDINLEMIPVMPPPPGMASNFTNPPSLALLSQVLFSILIGLSIVFVACRIIYNCSIVRKLKADDICVLFALLFGIGLAVITIPLLNVSIFILPLPLLRALQLSARKKLGILLVFLTASLVITKMNLQTDYMWGSWELTIVTMVESYVAIIVACVPGTAGFFRKYISSSKYYVSATNSLYSTLNSVSRSQIAMRSGISQKRERGMGLGSVKGGAAGAEWLGSTTHLQGWNQSVSGSQNRTNSPSLEFLSAPKNKSINRITMHLTSFLTAILATSTTTAFVIQQSLPTTPITPLSSFAYVNCGLSTDALQISTLTLSPDPSPENLTITSTFSVISPILDGAYVDITVKLGLVKLLQKRYDICEVLKERGGELQCPIEKGGYEVTQTVALPKEIPSAKFVVNARAVTTIIATTPTSSFVKLSNTLIPEFSNQPTLGVPAMFYWGFCMMSPPAGGIAEKWNEVEPGNDLVPRVYPEIEGVEEDDLEKANFEKEVIVKADVGKN
ncbi:hypothetical protein G7Y89_g12130 [Cudoniella acicularis]|uniref:MD-2-related lipid-recognition domain-containing protein n=1 Tax=Cudoniella acicularis TaxID=354080 RepID=A0A8H4R9G7_9HELO|nr:hypothetical protein G7Y89_g12130 [Cudoniella acicularis]